MILGKGQTKTTCGPATPTYMQYASKEMFPLNITPTILSVLASSYNEINFGVKSTILILLSTHQSFSESWALIIIDKIAYMGIFRSSSISLFFNHIF